MVTLLINSPPFFPVHTVRIKKMVGEGGPEQWAQNSDLAKSTAAQHRQKTEE
jgi:hypothetical protein